MGIQTETSNLMFLQNILHQWRIHEKRVKLWLCKQRSNAQRKDKRQNELAAKITLRHNLKRSIQITSQRPRRARWPRSLFAVVETGCEILPQSGSFHDHSKTTLAILGAIPWAVILCKCPVYCLTLFLCCSWTDTLGLFPVDNLINFTWYLPNSTCMHSHHSTFPHGLVSDVLSQMRSLKLHRNEERIFGCT